MSDTLEVFGRTWTGVEGIKATDDNGDTVTFEKGGGASWDDIATGVQPSGLITINSATIKGYQMAYNPTNNWKLYAPT